MLFFGLSCTAGSASFGASQAKPRQLGQPSWVQLARQARQPGRSKCGLGPHNPYKKRDSQAERMLRSLSGQAQDRALPRQPDQTDRSQVTNAASQGVRDSRGQQSQEQPFGEPTKRTQPFEKPAFGEATF